MKTVRVWLPFVAAVIMAVPACAEQVNAPESRWQQPTVETSTVNWPRLAWDTQIIAQGEDSAQNSAQSAASTPQAPAQQTSQDSTQASAPTTGSQVPSSQAAPQSTSATQPAAQDATQHQKAEQQLKEQVHQRVLGIVPSFNVSYRSDAVSLTGAQKIRLAFRSSIDPVTFATAFMVAGYHEAADDVHFGWGVEGYGQRAGAAYLDSFNSNMIGNGILPALLHQDPRYFRLGHGSVSHRLLYATAAAFMCKHDNTGKWEPNYSNIGGNIITGAISNLYYPGSNSGAGLTIENGMIVTAEGAFGAMFQEFWPDISRKLLHKDPTHGRDAQISSTGAPSENAKGQAE